MNLNIENQQVIGLDQIKNLNTKDLEILGVILVVNNQNNQPIELAQPNQKASHDDSLLTPLQVYQMIKKKEPVTKTALRCFTSRLRNQGLAAIPIGGSYLYRIEDLQKFLNKRKEG